MDPIIDPDKKGGWTTSTFTMPLPAQPKVPAIVQAAGIIAHALYLLALAILLGAVIGG